MNPPLSLTATVAERKLWAYVEHQVGRTEATIYYGPHTLGRAMLDGRVSVEEAVKAFEADPGLFGVNGKAPPERTQVHIYIGLSLVAHNCLDGKYTDEEAIALFQADPTDWTAGYSFDLARTAGLVSSRAFADGRDKIHLLL